MNHQALVSSLLFLAVCKGQNPTEDALLEAGRKDLYAANFVQAMAEFERAEIVTSADPRPAFFQGLTQLWRSFYFGYDEATARSLSSNASRAIQKADRLIARREDRGGETYFWRGASRSLQIAALVLPEVLRSEKRRFNIEGLIAGLSIVSAARSVEADLDEALKKNSRLDDARALLVVFQQCQRTDHGTCVGDLSASTRDLRWIDTEIKYILLNLVSNNMSRDEVSTRAAPIAIELRSKYPSNGLFHLALARVSCELSDLDSCRRYSSEIAASNYAGTFKYEALYLLGLLAGERSDWKGASGYFSEISRAAPPTPGYLLPWALLRAAQSEEALGNLDAAKVYGQRAIDSAYPNENLHDAARHLMSMIAAERQK